jgi:hypothetical protein
LSFVGEGLNGDYDVDDPEDKPIYRFYIQKKVEHPEGLGALFGPDWDDVEGSTYATQIPTVIPRKMVKKVLEYFISQIEELSPGSNVRGIAKQLSWTEVRDENVYNRFLNPRVTPKGPSMEKIMSDLLLDHGDATSLKEAMRELDAPEAMQVANVILHGHGIDSLRGSRYLGSYWHDTALLYVNRGETYSTTLLYDVERNRYEIGSWGDWVEIHEVRGDYRAP